MSDADEPVKPRWRWWAAACLLGIGYLADLSGLVDFWGLLQGAGITGRAAGLLAAPWSGWVVAGLLAAALAVVLLLRRRDASSHTAAMNALRSGHEAAIERARAVATDAAASRERETRADIRYAMYLLGGPAGSEALLASAAGGRGARPLHDGLSEVLARCSRTSRPVFDTRLRRALAIGRGTGRAMIASLQSLPKRGADGTAIDLETGQVVSEDEFGERLSLASRQRRALREALQAVDRRLHELRVEVGEPES